jgi:hypothetical protein
VDGELAAAFNGFPLHRLHCGMLFSAPDRLDHVGGDLWLRWHCVRLMIPISMRCSSRCGIRNRSGWPPSPPRIPTIEPPSTSRWRNQDVARGHYPCCHGRWAARRQHRQLRHGRRHRSHVLDRQILLGARHRRPRWRVDRVRRTDFGMTEHPVLSGVSTANGWPAGALSIKPLRASADIHRIAALRTEREDL